MGYKLAGFDVEERHKPASAGYFFAKDFYKKLYIGCKMWYKSIYIYI